MASTGFPVTKRALFIGCIGVRNIYFNIILSCWFSKVTLIRFHNLSLSIFFSQQQSAQYIEMHISPYKNGALNIQEYHSLMKEGEEYNLVFK